MTRGTRTWRASASRLVRVVAFPSAFVMNLGLAALVLTAGAVAQSPQSQDPLALVGRAEQLCAAPDKEEKEDAILLLWDAFEQLGARAAQPEGAAGLSTALALLQANDPLHGERLAACTAVARAHADLALLYRGKKWFATASQCLDLAERFDRVPAARERANLVAAWPKGLERPSSSAPARDSLLQRSAALRAEGPWAERGDVLECGPHPANTPWYDWVLPGQHEDCELSIEFRSSDAKAGHDCALLVGLDSNTAFYQVIAAYYTDKAMYDLVILEHDAGKPAKLVGGAWVSPVATPDGFHRLTFRVHGDSLRAQLDSTPAVEVKASVVPRGRFGVTVGIHNQPSVAVTLRNLRCDPWPPLTEEAVRARAEAAAQKRIGQAVDSAPALLARKEAETAASALRAALRDADSLAVGAVRTNLTRSIEAMLAKADLLHPRRKKAGQDGARAFVALAERYATAGQLRAAHRLAVIAAELDPEGSAAKLAATRQAVEEWKKTKGR